MSCCVTAQGLDPINCQWLLIRQETNTSVLYDWQLAWTVFPESPTIKLTHVWWDFQPLYNINFYYLLIQFYIALAKLYFILTLKIFNYLIHYSFLYDDLFFEEVYMKQKTAFHIIIVTWLGTLIFVLEYTIYCTTIKVTKLNIISSWFKLNNKLNSFKEK